MAGELGAQIADMAVDRSVGQREAGAAQPVDDRVAAEHLGWHRRQRPQDAELGNGQGHGILTPLRLPALGIEGQAAVLQRRRGTLDLGRSPAHPAQDRHHAGDHLARAKRLRDIIVGAELDAEDAIDLVVARGEEKDRQIALAAQAPADLDPIHPRHVDVEHDQVRPVFAGLRQRGLAILGFERVEPSLGESEDE